MQHMKRNDRSQLYCMCVLMSDNNTNVMNCEEYFSVGPLIEAHPSMERNEQEDTTRNEDQMDSYQLQLQLSASFIK